MVREFYSRILGVFHHKLEKTMAPYSSTLAWRVPWMEEPGRLQSMGSQRVGHDWTTSLSLFIFMHWRRKWQPTPVFLSGKFHGERSLAGLKESDMNEHLIHKVERKRRWGKRNEPPATTPEAIFIQRWCVSVVGILYYELLPGNQMINSNKCSSQLGQLKIALEEKCLELVNRKCVIFQQDNARPHVSLITRWKLL